MGIFYWILKNGPGSPGYVTKHLCKNFIDLKKEKGSTDSEIFSFMLFLRFPGLNPIMAADIVNQSHGELVLMNFNIILFENRDKLEHFQRSIEEVIKVVYEVSQKRAKELVTISFENYRYYALSNFKHFVKNNNL